MNNVFAAIPAAIPDEMFESLIETAGFRVERIVSFGHASPPGFWYDQDQHEWVLVLRGRAKVRFADTPEVQELGPGDYLDIPAHRRHRIEWTTPAEPTIWLAIHGRH